MHQRILLEQQLKRLKLRHVKKLRYFGGGLFLLLISLLILLTVDHLFPPNLARFEYSSPLLYDNEGELLSIALSKEGYWRVRAKHQEIDPMLIKMLIQYEDKRFYYHPGVDPLALVRALGQWIKAGRVISGGSTLTLQTVRLLEPRKRSIKNKMIECLRAVQLEAHFSKKQILEIYLSLAPYGGNYEGIHTASLRYFGKSPKHLSHSEAAMLVVMPQLPNHLRPELYPTRARKFRDKVIDRMAKVGVLSSTHAEQAKEDQLPHKVHEFPRYALHVLNSVLKREQKNRSNLYHYHYSTLNKPLQNQIEQLLKSELPFLESTQTIAAIVVDNQTHSIRAYVGNADFFDENRHGQINMIEHVRSPGSTLKPFIYGMGFDDGIIHPETFLNDIPTVYGEYAPSNFKDIFHGEVTVREALQQSLNIPVVTVLEKIKPGRFIAQLQNCGVKLYFKDAMNPATLPVALGGVGITLRDLVNLYVALANEGEFWPIQLWNYEQGNKSIPVFPKPVRTSLLSPMATWQVNHILEGTTPPDGFVNGDFTQGPVIAYKTGTSYGFRDAWAIGYTKDITVGVWVGKPDGSPSINQTGRINAAPILFKIMRLLPTPKQRITANMPKSLVNTSSTFSSQYLPRSSLKLIFKPRKKIAEVAERTLSIQFPKDGMVIHTERDSGMRPGALLPINIILRGGTAPYYLFCNGKESVTEFQEPKILWQPPSLGFHELTVIDSQGHSQTMTIELQ